MKTKGIVRLIFKYFLLIKIQSKHIEVLEANNSLFTFHCWIKNRRKIDLNFKILELLLILKQNMVSRTK